MDNIDCIINQAREFQKNIYFCFIDYGKVFDCVDQKKKRKEKLLRKVSTRPPTCLLRNLYTGQETTVRSGYGTTDLFKIRKGVWQTCIFSLHSHSHAEYIRQHARFDEAQAGIKIARRNTNSLRFADDTTLMAEREEELKSLLVKEESEKAGLEHNIQKTRIMASSPITSQQIEGETVTDFIFLGSKISEEGDCSHGIKRCYLFGRKTMINLNSILKSRDISLPMQACLVKAIAFPLFTYGCESWTIRKAEH